MKKIIILLLTFAVATNVWGARFAKSSTSYQKIAGTGLKMRELRKVGLGVQAGGALGSYGIGLELNFQPDFSTSVGFGMGSGYQAMNVQFKKYIGGQNFLPFITAGVSRWFTASRAERDFTSSSPEFLADKFLSESEKNGRFSKNIIYPGFGVQYMHLKGPWAGSSVSAEILLLVSIDDFASAAVGSVGYTYYF